MIQVINTYIPSIPVEFTGKWIAWNRDQTKIIASGRTFEEAKRAAAAEGEFSLLLSKVPDAWFGWRRGRSPLHTVAVFVSTASA